MTRSTDRILTTHAGSLTRTREIIEAQKARVLGEPVDEKQFKKTTATGITDVVRRQVEAGIDIPSDGEYGRHKLRTYIAERISGVERSAVKPDEAFGGPDREREQFPGFFAQYYRSAQFAWMLPDVDMHEIEGLRNGRGDVAEVFQLVGPLGHRADAVGEDIATLRAALAGHEVADAFITAVTPTNMARQYVNVLDFYPTLEAYQYALADVMREEYKAIVDAGFILQLDRPALEAVYQLDNDDEIAKAFDAAIEVENYALRGIPQERVRLHWCGGSANRPHVQDLPMSKLVKAMLRLNVGAYGFEAANPRHEHEWQVWEDVKLPAGKIIVPGLVSQSTNVVEHPELIAWRIGNFARLVGRENVIAGVDCGFSQGWDHLRTHPEVQWAKLRALAEGAAIATEQLWRTKR